MVINIGYVNFNSTPSYGWCSHGDYSHSSFFRGQAAYAKAATVVEQTIGSIRTVASFTGEKQAINSYKKFITSAYKQSIQQGFSTGLGLGVMFMVFFSSYALAIWFGGKMIVEKGYTGGAVINVIIIVVAGSMSLGQTSPCLTAFAAEINKGHDYTKTSPGSSFRASNLKKSMEGSVISGGTSSAGNSSRHHSLNVLGLAAGLDLGGGSVSQRVGQEETGSSSQEPVPKVSLTRIAALNKTEIPVLLLGTVAQPSTYAFLLVPLGFATFVAIANFIALLAFLADCASLVVVAGGKLIRRIRSMCFEKAVHMEVGWFDEPQNSSGTMGARLSADAALIKALVGDALSLAVQNAASAVSGLIIAFTASWELAFIILVMLPLIGINGYIQVKFMKGFTADAKSKYEDASQVANDAVGSIRTVASFCAEEKVMQMYKKQCEGPIKDGIKQGFISGLGFGVSFFILFSVYATSFYAGARLVEAGRTTFNNVFQVFFALTMAAIGISQSSTFAPDSSKAKVAAASIFGIIDRKSKIDSSDESGTVLENVKGDIELRHISFTYPARPDIQIFRDLCLSIRAGKNGVIAEKGTHEKLIRIEGGVYASLVQLHMTASD
ncbi:hypothetical protein Bca52824_015771 [Brassica carinata]|uniref:ABC transmembrane type-1 domain-containing protein n=1 Tax=Brassica carinata TaxID=52824 RepID=A0A8X7W5P7_BRACI|nr:hypothetical protein Bca52824_015771 [Brassica carinata]